MSARVLIVDDSATARRALRLAIEPEDDLEVVGELADGKNLLSALRRLRPDLVTMDVFLGAENGLDLASMIMREAPCPILVITAADPKNPRLAYRTLEAGALDVVAKLPSPTHEQYESRRRKLTRLIRTLARVPVVQRRRREGARAATGRDAQPTDLPTTSSPSPRRLPDLSAGRTAIVAIGASTGGPPVVARILRALPSPFPAPIAIVQHITVGFAEGHCSWLGSATGHPTRLVTRATELEPGVVYLPGDDMHLEVTSQGWVRASSSAPRRHQRPSVDVLFESVAEHYGAGALGVLLTGMGNDGAAGLRRLKDEGGVTMAQDPSTCAVGSMPESAIRLDVVDVVGDPETLPVRIRELCCARATRR